MASTVFPVPASGGGASSSPFDAPFQFNFNGGEFGQTVTLDLTNTVGAGSYTFSGVANYQSVPYGVQLLDASGTVVGSGTFSVSQGSLNTENSGSYNGSITATSAFTKIKFYGDGGNIVRFSSTVPTTPNYHISISSGSRTESNTTWETKIFSDANKVTLGAGPTTVPSGFYICGWYWNQKFYAMTQSIEGNPTGSTNTVRIYAWNYSTQSWSASLASGNGSTIGKNNFATFYQSKLHNIIFPFKNGKVMIYNSYMFNTNGSGTPDYAGSAWTFDMNTNSLSGTSVTGASLFYGASAYNPTNDEWYHQPQRSGGYGTANQQWARIQNDYTNTYMSTNYQNQSGGVLMACQNAANPKIAANLSNYSQGYLSAESALAWSTGSLTSSYTTNSTTHGNYGWMAQNLNSFNGTKSVQTTFNGVSNILLAIGTSSTETSFVGGPYQFPTSSAGYQQVGPYGSINNFGQAGGTNYYSIQPINSTQYGIVKYNDFTGNTAEVVPFPPSVTLP